MTRNVLTQAQLAATKLTVKSAINPALWFAAIVSPLCFVAALFFSGILQERLVTAGLVPIGLVCVAYIFFMLFDRDRLHSEEFQLKKLGLIRSQSVGELPNADDMPLIPPPQS